MADRCWTVMVVPHGSDSPRSYSISERAVRAALYVGAMLGLMAAIGLGTAIATTGRFISGAVRPTEANAMSSHPRDMSEVAKRMASLRDTLEVIRKREAQIRLLAGLPATDSAARILATAQDSLANSAARGLPHADVEALIERADQLSARFAAVTDSLERNAQRFASVPSIMPTPGWLTSQFSRSRNHPLLHISRPHEGIDVAAPMGAPIIAPASGVVMRVGYENGYGNTLEIDHGNGIVTRYAHCSRIDVKGGQRVTRGQTIAAVGSTGLATGPHLHYEIHINGKVVNPLTYVLSDAIPD
ncbi:MAG TPA: M23 family metallopeptidase [Gemmatimonadaceae bacterium]|nr:M23 family metallopeptidase [Gemmatimonadaceae bacterium]